MRFWLWLARKLDGWKWADHDHRFGPPWLVPVSQVIPELYDRATATGLRTLLIDWCLDCPYTHRRIMEDPAGASESTDSLSIFARRLYGLPEPTWEGVPGPWPWQDVKLEPPPTDAAGPAS